MVIIQPTPEIESKPGPGEDQNEDNVEETETTTEIVIEEVQEDVVVEEMVQNPEFTLEKPTPKTSEGRSHFNHIFF